MTARATCRVLWVALALVGLVGWGELRLQQARFAAYMTEVHAATARVACTAAANDRYGPYEAIEWVTGGVTYGIDPTPWPLVYFGSWGSWNRDNAWASLGMSGNGRKKY
jgi:hypothetical protein